MFKKSLIAVAVLGATAFSVQAADVTMYGKVDLGLQYKTSEVTVGDKTMVDEDTFSMENGRNSASRFGIKGSEDLGNGMKVSFQLENGFKADSGALKTEQAHLRPRSFRLRLLRLRYALHGPHGRRWLRCRHV